MVLAMGFDVAGRLVDETLDPGSDAASAAALDALVILTAAISI